MFVPDPHWLHVCLTCLTANDKDMVTLTQAQFDQILETIGELSVMSDGGAGKPKTSDSIDLDAPLPQVTVPPTPAPAQTQRCDVGSLY